MDSFRQLYEVVSGTEGGGYMGVLMKYHGQAQLSAGAWRAELACTPRALTVEGKVSG